MHRREFLKGTLAGAVLGRATRKAFSLSTQLETPLCVQTNR